MGVRGSHKTKEGSKVMTLATQVAAGRVQARSAGLVHKKRCPERSRRVTKIDYGRGCARALTAAVQILRIPKIRVPYPNKLIEYGLAGLTGFEGRFHE